MRVTKCKTCNVVVAIDMSGDMTEEELATKFSYHDKVCIKHLEEGLNEFSQTD